MEDKIGFIVLIEPKDGVPWPPDAGSVYDREGDADGRARDIARQRLSGDRVHVCRYLIGSGWQRGANVITYNVKPARTATEHRSHSNIERVEHARG